MLFFSSVTFLLILFTQCASAHAQPRATQPGASLSREAILRRAAEAPLGRYIFGLQPDTDQTLAGFDADAGQWTVTYFRGKWPLFRVVVDGVTGGLVSQTILRRDGSPAATLGDAETLVRAAPDIGHWIAQHENTRLDPHYEADHDAWFVQVFLDEQAVGHAWVRAGGVSNSVGPWLTPPGAARVHERLWLRLRPAFSFRQVTYLFGAIFLVLVFDLGRLLSWRNLDALIIAALVPAVGILKVEPVAAALVLLVCTAYLVVRLAAIGLRQKTEDPAPAPGPSSDRTWERRNLLFLLLILLSVVVAWNAAKSGQVERGVSDNAGAELGGELLRTGAFDLGPHLDYHDAYGPIHFIMHGLVTNAVEALVGNWGRDVWEPDLRGSRCLAILFHLLAVAAIIGVARTMSSSSPPAKKGSDPLMAFRRGLTPCSPEGGRAGHVVSPLALATAYIVLSVALRHFFTTSRVPPAALITAGLWAWPNPWLTGACLGLATGDLLFPVFLLPLWLGSFGGRARLKFLAVYVAIGVACAAVLMHGPQPALWRLDAWLTSVAGAQQMPIRSELLTDAHSSFWAAIAPGSPIPGYLRNGLSFAYLGLCLVLFRWPRGKSRTQLIALSAMLICATQLWKGSNGGEYIEWYLPFALLALYSPQSMEK
jgi:hypothetical protein